jgi:hypothetical protein
MNGIFYYLAVGVLSGIIGSIYNGPIYLKFPLMILSVIVLSLLYIKLDEIHELIKKLHNDDKIFLDKKG